MRSAWASEGQTGRLCGGPCPETPGQVGEVVRVTSGCLPAQEAPGRRSSSLCGCGCCWQLCNDLTFPMASRVSQGASGRYSWGCMPRRVPQSTLHDWGQGAWACWPRGSDVRWQGLCMLRGVPGWWVRGGHRGPPFSRFLRTPALLTERPAGEGFRGQAHQQGAGTAHDHPVSLVGRGDALKSPQGTRDRKGRAGRLLLSLLCSLLDV